MPFLPMYNRDLVVDNEYGALDNDTLNSILEDVKSRAVEEQIGLKESQINEDDYYKRGASGLSQAQIDAKKAQEDAKAAYEAAVAEQERLKVEKAAADKQAAEAAAKAAASKAAAEAAAKAAADKAAAEAAARAAAEKAAAEAAARAANTTTTTANSFTTSTLSTSGSASGSAYGVSSNTTPGPNITPTPTPPVLMPLSTSLVETKPPVKTAPIDTVLTIEEEIPEASYDLLWEDIGGQELINIARNDTVNGQTVLYQPIKNITQIQQQYNPNNIVALQDTSDKYFSNFSIKLETKMLEEPTLGFSPEDGGGSGPNGEYVYIDTNTGDLILETRNMATDEQIEVEISLGGTIYEAEFNES